MNLYAVYFDGMPKYVEARSMGEAIRVWDAWMRVEQGADWLDTDQPESVELISDDGPVLRG